MDLGGDPKKYPAWFKVGDCPVCNKTDMVVCGVQLKNKMMVYLCDPCFTRQFKGDDKGGGIRNVG